LFFAKYSIDAIAYLLLCFLVLTLKKVSQLEFFSTNQWLVRMNFLIFKQMTMIAHSGVVCDKVTENALTEW